ncbi:hypothetical protein [Alkalihalobacillus deserti]|uniref:hypothetical protein n=1 Tax=Alkalihalobacillus deserti TaxID=2879466 RepID=UPI001D148FDA|nr:hypothetical protein [Alkalihalobacillus deserti]
MFGLEDVKLIFLALFVVFPLVSFIHETGYLFFAYLFGAKELKLTIGCGKPIFRWKILEFRRYYFWYGWCYYKDLQNDTRLSNILVYSGPVIFNITSGIFLNWLTLKGVIKPSIFTYQFVYFSLYFAVFDLIPMTYQDGQPSNGRVIYELLRYGRKNSYQKGDYNQEMRKIRNNTKQKRKEV